MNDNIFKDLNVQQKKAVESVKGSSIILAGAGSGKTRVLVYKVLNLINNYQVDPGSMIMITFTNKAAQEMKKRIGVKKMGYVGTFHSLCARILRIEGQFIGIGKDYVIYDQSDQINLIKSILKKTKLEKKYTPAYYSHRISEAKNQLMTPEEFQSVFSQYPNNIVGQVYYLYQAELKKANALDFDDLIMKTTELFTKEKPVLKKYQNKYRYIFVDEFQDTNYAQYVLTKLLGKKYGNITIVGDFSQSIYSWRGAEIKNLEKFQKDFPKTKVFSLEQNYRSTQEIINFAYRVISKNQLHPILNVFTKNKKGEKVNFYQAGNEQDEALFIASQIDSIGVDSSPPGTNYGLHRDVESGAMDFTREDLYNQCAVFYRTNAQSRVLEEAFLHYGIPYRLIGGIRFYERKEIKDVLSYLRLLLNPLDSVAKERVIKIGKRRWKAFKEFYQETKNNLDSIPTIELIDGIFEATRYLLLYNPEEQEDYARLENIKELKSVAIQFPKLSDLLDQVSLVESEYSEGEKKKKQGVSLMTLHQAKGLEFNYVFITGVEEGLLPHSRSSDDLLELEEERRLFYVGVTRAMEKLFITYTKRRFIFGRRIETIKSRFIDDEVEERLSW